MAQVFNSSNVKISEAESSTPRFRNYGGTEDTGMFQKGTTDFGYPDLQEIGTGLKNPDMTKDYGWILSKDERTPQPKIVSSIYHPRPDNWEALSSTDKKDYVNKLLDKHYSSVKDGVLQRAYQYGRPYEHPDPRIGKTIQLYNVDDNTKHIPDVFSAPCSICGKKDCTGLNDRGFGRHGGKCKFCGKTDCTGDEDKGFGIHYLNSRAEWHEEPDSRRRDRNNKPKRVFRPGRPEPSTEEGQTRYTSLDEALIDILSQHPAIKSQNIDPRKLIGTNDVSIVLPGLQKKKSSKMIFNASDEFDPDDYEYLQSSSNEPTEGLDFNEAPDVETSEIEKESDNDVGADVVRKNVNFDALKVPGLEKVAPDVETDEFGSLINGSGVDTGSNERHPEDFKPSYYDVATVPCPICFGESKKNNLDNYNYTSNHCKKCDGSCGSDERNGANHCLGCKNPEKCKGREHEAWTYKDPDGKDILDENKKLITTCPMCGNDGEISEQYADALISAVNPEAPTQIESDVNSTKKTKKIKAPKIPKLQHIPDERAEDFSDDDDEIAGAPVVTSPSTPEAIPAPNKNTFSLRELPGGKVKKSDDSLALPDIETPNFMDLRGLSDLRDKTTSKSHNNCGCTNRGGRKINGNYRPGLASDQEIAKIKQSDDYKKGIAAINSSTEPGTKKRDQKLDEFIESQYRCKGDE